MATGRALLSPRPAYFRRLAYLPKYTISGVLFIMSKKLYVVSQYEDWWFVIASNKKQAREIVYDRKLDEEKYLARWEYENEESKERALKCGYTLEELEEQFYRAGSYNERDSKNYSVYELKEVDGYEVFIRPKKKEKKR